jgi:DNA-binding CsgD family transcriptional regulator
MAYRDAFPKSVFSWSAHRLDSMRRLILEFSLKDLNPTSYLHKVKSFEIVHILRLEPDEFSALVKVNFGNNPSNIRELFPESSLAKVELELLEQSRGTFTYFLKVTPAPGQVRPQVLSQLTSGGFLATPFEVRDGKMKTSFLGTAKQMRDILRSVDKTGMKYKVLSLSDAKFSPSSPLHRLTEKQREVLDKAYNLGYYDRPKKISSEELAKQLGLSKSTFVAHRRKAERRLLEEVLNESSR